MALDAHDRKLIDRTTEAIRIGCADRLGALLLCGEAASAAYRPRRSRLELAVVVDTVDQTMLALVSRVLPRDWRDRLATPLLLDQAYIQSALDVFPLEFLDLTDRHELLVGEYDPFAELVFEREHLRLQVEQQLRGKLLHLWEAYLASRGSRRRVRRMLIDTPAAFETIARGILYLADSERPTDPLRLVSAVEAALDIRLPTLTRLERVRSGRDKLGGGEIDATFTLYLEEVRAMVKSADRL
jgi:hypothetical protein